MTVRGVLDRQVPLREERAPDWADVLSRSARRGRTRGRRLLAGVAIAAALVIVASALAATGRGPFGDLSSWLDGAPGEPASRAEKAGFAARDGASYEAFPADVEVRRLADAQAGSERYRLLGFTSGRSLCLRLVQADSPGANGRDECVTRAELDTSAAPALVASETRWLATGNPRERADAIFGLADDTVAAVEYRAALSGWHRVAVANNVFLAVHAYEPEWFAYGARLEDSIIQVRAVTRHGERVDVPFIAGWASFAGGVPSVPSYLAPARPTAADLPGPTTVRNPATDMTIGWLERGEERGRAWKPEPPFVGKVVHARVVQPDPDDPASAVGLYLVGGQLVTPPGFFGNSVRPGGLTLCVRSLRPSGGVMGEGCRRIEGAGRRPAKPFFGGYSNPSEHTHLAGAASDSVAAMRLFLASGHVLPVALRDNAYSTSAPFEQFPAKLVAYDDAGRVIAMVVYPGPLRPTPCPALPVWPASRLPATKPYERLDLGALTVNGAQILGRTPDEVKAVLGTPDPSSLSGRAGTLLFYGGRRFGGAELFVQFARRKGELRARSLMFHGRGLADPKLGNLLNVQPQALQASIAATYRGTLHLSRDYAATPAMAPRGGCTSQFAASDGTRVSFGVEPYAGGRPFLTLSR